MADTMWPLTLDMTRDECRGLLRQSGKHAEPIAKERTARALKMRACSALCVCGAIQFTVRVVCVRMVIGRGDGGGQMWGSV